MPIQEEFSENMQHHRGTILIVDDTPANLDLLSKMLEEKGYSVRPTTSGKFALKSVEISPPDLILLDIKMPEMDGYEVCRHLKGKQQTADIPVIFISALDESEDKIKAFQAGGVDYVTKPFQTEEVLARIHTHLTLRHMQQDLERLVRDRTSELLHSNEELHREIEERKRIEYELANSKAQLQLALRASKIGLWDWNLITNDVYFSPEWKKQIGYEDDEIASRYEEWKTRLHPKDYDRVISELQDYMDGRKPNYATEFRLRHKNGSYRWIFVRGEILQDTDGNPSRMLGCHIDVTSRRNLENQLMQAQKMEAIGTLAGGIAHDFNNILTSILGFTYLAKNKLPEGSKGVTDLEYVLKGGDRAVELVKQILAFSRIGKEELQPIIIEPIIKEALKMLRASIPSTIEIRQSIASTALILADHTQIHQVLMNLCTNAYHAMKEERGVIGVDLSEVNIESGALAHSHNLNHGMHVKLSVSDTGIGIDPLNIDKIFDPYFTTKEKGKGTGLGLSVVHGIIKKFGGTITVESELSKGTTFHVYLPIIQLKQREEEEPKVTISKGTGNILLVDDETSIVIMGKEMLSDLGYNVEGKTDSVEALELFREDPDKFDVVITDMTMPGMTGIELAREITNIRPDLPILLSTGYGIGLNEDMVKQLGIREVLMKPVSPVKFATAIHKVLQVRPEKA